MSHPVTNVSEMARSLRIQYPGAWYHVTNRAPSGRDLFITNADRLIFLELLAIMTQRFGVEVHAYCLMGNHYHLVLHTPRGNLAAAMQHLNSSYAMGFNRRHGLDGPAFRSRYKASLIEADAYLNRAVRYVHRNPIGHGFATSCASYRWSSYRSYLGTEHTPWLGTEAVLAQYGGSLSSLRSDTESTAIDAEIELFFGRSRTSPVLGSSGFAAEALKLARHAEETNASRRRAASMISVAEIDKVVAELNGLTVPELHTSRSLAARGLRVVALWLARLQGHTLLRELAQHYGFVSYGAASAALHRFRAQRRVRDCNHQLQRYLAALSPS